MKTKKLKKQLKKDLKAQVRMSEMFRDKERVARLERYIVDNKNKINKMKINIYIKKVKGDVRL